MKKQTITLTGYIRNELSKAGLPNLRIEAWDRDNLKDDIAGSGVTDSNGKFSISLQQKAGGWNRTGREPDIYFMIYDGDRLLHNTIDNVMWNLDRDRKDIEIFIPMDVGAISADDPNFFTVRGKVTNDKGEVVKKQKLIAYDVDLRGAGVYRTAKTVKEINDNGGFELLKESSSDIKGHYYIEFYSEQFEKAERKKADVIVVAVNKNGEIIGRSALVNSEDYSDKGEVANLDLVITETDRKTEYDLLMKKLQSFLRESKVELIDLAKSNDQVKFTSGELDESEARIQLAVDAESLKKNKRTLSHELFYGIGRQNIKLDWSSLYEKSEEQLKSAIEKSREENIIKKYSEKEIAAFLKLIHGLASSHVLEFKGVDKVSLEEKLSAALPEKKQQQAFVNAYRNFKDKNSGTGKIDYKNFWSEYLPNIKEFKSNPKLIPALLLSQQLTILSGNHHPLVEELQKNLKIKKITDLIAMDDDEWKEIITKTGVPEFITLHNGEDKPNPNSNQNKKAALRSSTGQDDDKKIASYSKQIQSFLNAAYPTQKIAVMLNKNQLRVKDATVSTGIQNFLNGNDSFDISISNVDDFANEISADVSTELKKMQRIFSVSPAPEAMDVLMQNDLNSAYTISNIPKKSFIKMYSNQLGGERMADAVYQRAEHISTMASERAMKLHEVINSHAPAFAYSTADRIEVISVLESKFPNYSNLFGSPDICECEHCRSVYSAAAYFVDLLRFLEKSGKNDVLPDPKSPLDMFAERRPDLLHLPLTCENTNTIIPYIDLVNEVMEYYTAKDFLDKNAAYDTGKTTSAELRANPQNFKIEAYKKLNSAVYPFTLPYHQPLDVIRTYGDHLKIERHEVMKAMQKNPLANSAKAIEAETLKISEEEYRIITGVKFDGTPDKNDDNTSRQIQQFYGFPFSNFLPDPELDPVVIANMEKVAGAEYGIHEFLRRTGIKYVDLVELIKTKFINPHQDKLEYLEDLFGKSDISSADIYARLNQIYLSGGLIDPSETEMFAALDSADITPFDFTTWITNNFEGFDSVITLYQKDSLCDLDTTSLKTVHNVYANDPSSGIDNNTWSKIHRFIRLWRKLGWTIHEVDLMITALGTGDITTDTISKLSYVVLINKQLKLPINQLAAFWGSIDAYGDKSLYKKLFLNKAVGRIDDIFEANPDGNYPNDTTQNLNAHIPGMLAAFRMSAEDLDAICVAAPIDLATDKLNINTLSIIYRYTVLSKALRMKVPELCLLKQLFEINPFSNLDSTKTHFIDVLPSNTFDFIELVSSIKKSDFKTETLQYIFTGRVPSESTIGLNWVKATKDIPSIHEAFNIIEQTYPVTPSETLTAEQLRSNLLLTFDPDVVNELIGIIGTQQTFSVVTDKNLDVVVPTLLASKYKYDPATGNLTTSGIMTDDDRNDLRLLGISNDFKNAIDALYNKTPTSLTPQFSTNQNSSLESLAIVIPEILASRFTYNPGDGVLTSLGIMTDNERIALRELLNNTDYQDAVDNLFNLSLSGTPQSFSEQAGKGLAVNIPELLASRYRYDPVTGKITILDYMTDSERINLRLLGISNDFKNAVDTLYIQSKSLTSDCPSYSKTLQGNPTSTVIIPDSLSPKYSYSPTTNTLTCKGVMSDSEKDALVNLFTEFQTEIEDIYKMPEDFIKENFMEVFTFSHPGLTNEDLITLINNNLLNHPSQPQEKTLIEKLHFVYTNYIPFLKRRLHENIIIHHLAVFMGLSEETTASLIKNDLQYLIESIDKGGFTAEYFPNTTFTAPSNVKRIDKQIDYKWTDPLDLSSPSNDYSITWSGYLTIPSNGEYTLIVDVKEAIEEFTLYLDGVLILQKPSLDTNLSFEVPVQLVSSKIYQLALKYKGDLRNAGITLSWKTKTAAKEKIPSSAVIPFEELVNFVTATLKFHRAAKFISGFKLTTDEVRHFINYNSDFGNIDFRAIKPMHWKQINDYVQLRSVSPQAQSSLIEVFEAANRTTPDISLLRSKLNLATGWDLDTIKYLATYFPISINDFKNEKALLRIYDAVSLVMKTGLPADTLAQWATPETIFDDLNDTALLVKNTVKAKYEEEEWMKLAGNLSDKLRMHQRDALISHLLSKDSLISKGITDADGLFEYFLIDVQMGACMDTSRIVQGSAAVQMFVNRCLLNLESNKVNNPGHGVSEHGVSPDAIDRDRWDWMKRYRVWEVNRKIFCYPENWLEPEWRDDRSSFFKELESELTQNDITDRNVETAFRNYLTSLNTVANLDVCGMYQENYGDGKLKMIHVFGRTHNAPYQFFYRTCNEFYKWNAWEKVQVDIRMTEDGENSGVHLIPVVWKNRLLIFWTEFIKKQKENESNKSTKISALADSTPDHLKAIEYYEIRLAWSENVDGKWSPKQLSKEFINSLYTNFNQDKDIQICNVTYHTSLNLRDSSLSILLLYGVDRIFGSFHLTDIQSEIVIRYNWALIGTYDKRDDGDKLYKDSLDSHGIYRNFFMKHEINNVLNIDNQDYLQNNLNHKILYSHQISDFYSSVNYPFFFNHDQKTYFVKPVDVHPLEIFLMPEMNKPYIMLSNNNNVVSANTLGKSARIEELTVKGMEVHKGIIKNGQSLGNSVTVNGANPNVGSFVGNSFSGIALGSPNSTLFNVIPKCGLEFNTFYHPYSSQFVTNLNQKGMQGLMESDTNYNYNDGGGNFDYFDPNFYDELVQEAPLSAEYKAGESYTLYKENVCFDVFGANSIYNWELFFHAPLYIATRLSKNGKYEEAMKWFHYIFDPTTDEPVSGQSEISRYWKTLPFKTTVLQSLEEFFIALATNANPSASAEDPMIKEWRDNPFNPFIVARNRPVAFMKNVVIKYVENLREWGDSLFRMFTRESVNEALQIYVIANHILGPRPEFVPKRGEVKAETYDSLKERLDDFSNALVEMENSFPFSSAVPTANNTLSPALMGFGKNLYFGIPSNEKLMEHWDTIDDRLYKIRHCMDIDGVERQLALFSPPIDPAMLINAAAQGLSLGSILSDLSSPPPVYRFSYLMQKANEFCGEVKSLGSSLLSAIEKKDAEEMGRIRASHESAMLDLMTGIKERQILDAKVGREGLLKSRTSAEFRLKHYNALLSSETISVPGFPTLDANLNVDSQLPADTIINEIISDVDGSLVEDGESGVKLIPREKSDIDITSSIPGDMESSKSADIIAGFLGLIPQFDAKAEPLGVGAGTGFGGRQLSWYASSVGKMFSTQSSISGVTAGQAAKMASYIRREQEWTLQANLAAKEIIQLDKQITSADIKIQITQKELANHKQQIENSKQVEQFLKGKFTNQELYQWMKEQLFSIYKQSYNMAYDMAKKVEKCYRYELGNEISSFISYGYWDNTMQGLCAGEKLQLALRQMEKSYIEENTRDLELTKSISTALLNPLALQELRSTGKCNLSIPEEIYDLDYQGHYFRRIKSVSLSIPCIAGPYTTVNCTLRLLKNSIRINTSMNNGNYVRNNEEAEIRFRESNVPVKCIATSTAQRDSGMFELSFRDERYLPFEGAGAISEWEITLTEAPELRQFDYSTISDVILHINYTAREEQGIKGAVTDHLRDYLAGAASGQPLMRMFSMKHEFSNEWHKFLNPPAPDSDQELIFTISKEHFPFFIKDKEINVEKIVVLMQAAGDGDYTMDFNSGPVNIPNIPMTESPQLKMQYASLTNDDLDVFAMMIMKFKKNTVNDFKSISSEEISDLFIVFCFRGIKT